MLVVVVIVFPHIALYGNTWVIGQESKRRGRERMRGRNRKGYKRKEKKRKIAANESEPRSHALTGSLTKVAISLVHIYC